MAVMQVGVSLLNQGRLCIALCGKTGVGLEDHAQDGWQLYRCSQLIVVKDTY